MTAIRRVTGFVGALLLLAGFGASPVAANPGDPPGALTFGGLLRTYLVHVPAGLERPAGLVINLHGSGQTGADQAALTNYNAIADQYGFVVAYPDGIDLSWADGRGASVPDRQGIDDVGFLAALIERLSSEFGIAPRRVFVTGMSAGAFMTNRLACDRADLVNAIVPVAGTLGVGVPCAPSRPVSVLAIHGTADAVVPFGGGPMVGRGGPSVILSAPALAAVWRAAAGCPAPRGDGGPPGQAVRMAAVGCAGGTEVVLVPVDGGGHTWLDASQASAQFFASRAV
jgi:polyhydroxybutyrate depolymerase